MTNDAYQYLADDLTARGFDVEAIKTAIKNHHIETPSWGYANSGTRFKAFPWPGAATTTREKMDDAAKAASPHRRHSPVPAPESPPTSLQSETTSRELLSRMRPIRSTGRRPFT